MISPLALPVLYCMTVPAANWLTANVGVRLDADGPAMVPVGFGLMATTGALAVGLAFPLRDLVHRRLGARWAVAAILGGCLLSALVAPPALALASAAAFLLSELADFAVYAPLAERRFLAAVVASNAVGALLDTALFLWLAFGALDSLAGEVLGKAWVTLAVLPLVWWLRGTRADAR